MTTTTDLIGFSDGLENMITGMGRGSDKNAYNRWAPWVRRYSPAELDGAFRTNWLVRAITEIIPADMVREWRTWNEKDEKKVELLEAEEKRLSVQDRTHKALLWSRHRGGSVIFMGLPGNPSTPAPRSIGPGGLMYLHVLNKDQITISEMELDLMSPYYGQPKFYEFNSDGRYIAVHPSRVIPFHGMPIPDLSLGASVETFWGDPLLMSIDTAVQNSTLSQNEIAGLLHEAKLDVIGVPGLMDSIGTAEYEERLRRRFSLANLLKSSHNMLLMDAGAGGGLDGKNVGGETWETRQINWAGLPAINQELLTVVCAAAGIPYTRLIGTSAKGLNATGEGDNDNHDENITAKQKTDLRPRLERLDGYLGMSAGAPGRRWTFKPLQEPDQVERADATNKDADSVSKLVAAGIFQLDAVAQSAAKRFEDNGLLPGLVDAIAASKEEIPAIQKAKDEADAMKIEARTKAAVVAVGKGKTSKGTAAKPKAKAMKDAAPMPLYVSRQVLNPQEILNWAREQGIPGLEAARDLHVTVAYSRKPVDWLKIPTSWNTADDGKLRIIPGGARVVDRLGESGEAVALLFKSDELEWQHQRIIEAGASWDFESYQPHLSLSFDAEGFDVSKIEPYRGRIVLGAERFEELQAEGGVT